MKIKILPKDNFKDMPFRAHYNDAGADVSLLEDIHLKPHQTVKIPLGYGLELPDGVQAIIQPRSGMSSKGIFTQIAPIDSGYTGEIHAILTNTTNKSHSLEAGTRVGQIVVIPILLPEFVIELGDERGDGGFGSTN